MLGVGALLLIFAAAARATEIGLCTEYACASIDVCVSPNRDAWMHMSLPALALAAANTSSQAVRRFDLASATVPQGVVLEVCAPDFALAVSGAGYACDSATLRTVLGPQHTAGLSEHRRMQMVRYVFAEGYACGLLEEAGWVLEPANAGLQRQVSCARPVEHGHFDAGCQLVCAEDFTARNGSCVSSCAEAAAMCGPRQKAASRCELVAGSRYTCVQCEARAGFALQPWQPLSALECVHTACAEGTYGEDGECRACAVNSVSNGTRPCQSCNTSASGLFQALPEQGHCDACFGGGLPGPQCLPGRMLVQDFPAIVAYFGEYPLLTQHEDMFKYCVEGGACLPCPWGSREHEGACSLCPVGSFQNGFAQTVCIPCLANQTTHQSGSTAAAQCVCAPGSQ